MQRTEGMDPVDAAGVLDRVEVEPSAVDTGARDDPVGCHRDDAALGLHPVGEALRRVLQAGENDGEPGAGASRCPCTASSEGLPPLKRLATRLEWCPETESNRRPHHYE